MNKGLMKVGMGLLVLAMVVSAGASQVPVIFVGTGPGMGTNVSNGDGKTYSNFAGMLNMAIQWQPGNPVLTRVFCIEISEKVPTNWTLYNVIDPLDGDQVPQLDGWLENGPPMGDTKADEVRKLWASVIGPTYCDFVKYMPTAAQAAAMQLALWEVIFETPDNGTTDYDLDAGWFQAGALSYKDLAEQYLAGMMNYQGPLADLIALQNDEKQDFISIVPEPLTLVGSLLGLGALGGYIRKRKLA